MKPYVGFIVFLLYCFGDTSSAKKARRSDSWCHKAPGLSVSQRKLCFRVLGLETAIKKGIERGLSECEREFQWSRWNCSALVNKSLLERAPAGTREAAFTTALLSASIAYSVTKACTAKNVTECRCEGIRRPRYGQTWKRKGCSANAHFGTYSSERFMLNDRRNKSAIDTLVMKHNIRVGLQVLQENRVAKCTVGKTGRVKSCHLTLPPLHKISRIIKGKYHLATRVTAHKRGKNNSPFLRTIERYRDRPNGKRPRKSSLVYIRYSPTYCYRQNEYGIPGTRGRRCQLNSLKEGDCTLMCCGRGYKREAKLQKRFCDCKTSVDKPCSCKVCTDVIMENKCM